MYTNKHIVLILVGTYMLYRVNVLKYLHYTVCTVIIIYRYTAYNRKYKYI